MSYKIALIGASGFVGTALLQEARLRGHSITAITRTPEKLSRYPWVQALTADIYDTATLTGALHNTDVTINAWHPGADITRQYQLFLTGAASIQQAATTAGAARFIMIGNAGTLYIAPAMQWVDAPETAANWRPVPAAHRDYLHTLQNETSLNWTYITPPFELVPGYRTAHYRTSDHSPVYNEQGRSIISVQDFAVAVFDEIEAGRHTQQQFTVGY
ncbi:NAD(P)H-binding protein [Paraflavitalea sp. CAU 1676]|uniref:NAD(P)-dependent oxidoreductase n=1 Tax=Paraflavitalea sp. CAU 1676 TaxID=3032598 RepID=UPI0023DC0975|nr:NAD(P)H-binding protein [Paraflavitalea sp. CAU 1676]MDF2187331.1 NAD(P)H-binding protein [Paraflavitalea sp. CAU 1676]